MNPEINEQSETVSPGIGRMRADVKAQWVTALRSGEYRQGKHVLHNVNADTYCCLGVLCDLAVKAGVLSGGRQEYNSAADGDIEVYGANGDRHDKGGVTLPIEVIEWAGVIDDNPNVDTDEDGDGSLAGLNDEYNYTFAQLADLIEEQL